MSDYQTITALVANVIYVCALYKLLHGFLTSKRPFWQECCLYGAAYMVLTSVYLVWNIPLLTLVANIIVLLALSCAYPASWQRRLLAVAFVYGIVFLCETLVVKAAEAIGFAHFTDFSNKEYLIVQIISKFFIYVLALWLAKLGQLKNEPALPRVYWLALFAIPTLSLLPTYVLLMTVDKAWDMGVVVSVLILFVLNGLVLYLYEQIIQLYQDKLAQGAEREQARIISRQLEAEQEAMGKMRQLRHDWNNLLLPILAEMEIGDCESAETDLRQLITDISSSGNLVQDGDPVLAAVINYKLTDVQASGVPVRCQVDVPDDLKEHINVQMVSILLGNLLDNAVRAVQEDERAADEKYIDLKLSVRLGTLLIVVANSFDGYLRMAHGQYQTTKTDQQNHGLGLAAIRQIVENQQGDLAIETTGTEFKVRIKLFLENLEK